MLMFLCPLFMPNKSFPMKRKMSNDFYAGFALEAVAVMLTMMGYRHRQHHQHRYDHHYLHS